MGKFTKADVGKTVRCVDAESSFGPARDLEIGMLYTILDVDVEGDPRIAGSRGPHVYMAQRFEIVSVPAPDWVKDDATITITHAPAYPDGNPKTVHGEAKPSPALIPGPAVIALARVFGLGAKKYGPYNWRTAKVSSTVYVNAAIRHLYSYLDGEDIDAESGESHLAHAMACCAILIDARSVDMLNDNRPPAGKTADLIRAAANNKAPLDTHSVCFIINGEEVFVNARADEITSAVAKRALGESHNLGRPLEDWDLRDVRGRWLSMTGSVCTLRESRYFLSLRAGVGG